MLGSFRCLTVTLNSISLIFFQRRLIYKGLVSNINLKSDLNPKAIIIHDDINKTLSISFKYVNDEFKINKQFNFYRKSDERCSYVLSKINEKIVGHISKKGKKKSLELIENDIKIPINLVSKLNGQKNGFENLSLVETFINHKNYYLQIGDINYTLDLNPPLLTSLELPKKLILCGCLLYPIKLEGHNFNIEDAVFTWYQSCKKFETYEEAKGKGLKNIKWEEIGKSFKIKTKKENISRLIKVVGIPCNGEVEGPPLAAISNVLVSPSLEEYHFEKRHQETAEVLDNEFVRIVSYNLLADFYAHSEFSRTVLFPTCPPYALDIEYRKQLHIKEILGYNGDVICLQEVDKKIFYNDLKPLFQSFGIDGTYNSKGSSTSPEGLSVFYRRDKLKLLEENCFLLSQEVEVNSLFEVFLEKIKSCEKLYENFARQKTILQVCTFLKKGDPSKILVVGNTHLYSDPHSNHIRLLQAGVSMILLKNLIQKKKKQDPTCDWALLFCGDFNSPPETGVYRFLTSKLIEENEEDWKSKAEEEVNGLALSHEYELRSACGIPEYTNYTVGFKGCLDYIFYEADKLSVEKVVSFPSESELTEHEALPSIKFPSDHIALVADLKWKL